MLPRHLVEGTAYLRAIAFRQTAEHSNGFGRAFGGDNKLRRPELVFNRRIYFVADLTPKPIRILFSYDLLQTSQTHAHRLRTRRQQQAG